MITPIGRLSEMAIKTNTQDMRKALKCKFERILLLFSVMLGVREGGGKGSKLKASTAFEM